MVSHNEGPRRPKNHGKPNSAGLPPADLAKAESALSQEHLAQLSMAIALGRTGDLEAAAEVSKRVIRSSEGKGGIHEANVILAFLPALLPEASPDEVLRLAHRVVDLTASWQGYEHLTSMARFFAMQAQLRADRKPAALAEAEACVVAGKNSKIHCQWLTTAWRYYGMLLALVGKMPEALVAISNAIEAAKGKPTDDYLALARAHEAMGRTLLEIGETPTAVAALKKAADEFMKHGKAGESEAEKIRQLLRHAG